MLEQTVDCVEKFFAFWEKSWLPALVSGSSEKRRPHSAIRNCNRPDTPLEVEVNLFALSSTLNSIWMVFAMHRHQRSNEAGGALA